jgi:hypothetical protein
MLFLNMVCLTVVSPTAVGRVGGSEGVEGGD